MPPRSPPTRPTPYVVEDREVVAIAGASSAALEVVSGNHHDALVVSEPLEQLLAVGEERRVGDAIVLQNDRLLDLLKHPIDPGRDATGTPEVDRGILALHLARPVDLLRNCASGCARFCLIGKTGPSAIGHDQQPWRAGRSDSSEDLGRR